MCTTGFTMDPVTNAEPYDGPSLTGLAAIAREEQVAIVGGIPMREDGAFYNSAFLIDADGTVVAEYRKQRTFVYAGEDRHYASGSRSCVVTLNGVRLGLLICFDLRFPELFRTIAPDVDAVVIIANWPSSRRAHWEALMRARAIENQCYMVAVNRTGNADNLEYDGRSAVVGPWGDIVAKSSLLGSPAIATLDEAEVARVRTQYPFVATMVSYAERDLAGTDSQLVSVSA
jgi:predicted amidohydrolase